MSKKILILAALMIFVAGCSDAKIDASTDETIKTSIEKVRQSLPKDTQEKFDEALQTIALSQISLNSLFTDGASGISSTKEKMKDAINGKSGEELITEAELIKKERKEKEESQAISEIKELQDKQTQTIKSKESLKLFEVVRSRFYKKEQEYGIDQPIIELTIKNGTSSPIASASFKGTLASPNRSIPWLVEVFSYDISGGLEPGEEVKWSLAPNQFGEWGAVDAPTDAILTVEVEQLDGSNGEPLFSSRGFSETDEKRLKELKEKYNK